MSSTSTPGRLRFEHFELDPSERLLLASGLPVTITSRAFDLLLLLVARAGVLITKEELLAGAWRGLVVEENNLHVQVSTLRKIVGSQAIETVAGHGYRFTLAVEPVLDSGASPRLPDRHALPRPLTSFIGHEQELDEFARLLDSSRLLTLTGIGGCGKTRLAIRLGEAVFDKYEGGVRFVDLAPILDELRIPITVSTAFGARPSRDVSIVDAIAERTAGRRSLLILDNCEHALDACLGFVRDLLEHVPELSVLATSREGIGLPGERIAKVRSLSFPVGPSGGDPETLRAYEATRLFVERAQLLRPDWNVDEHNALAVSEICRRLDGIPLAIELAAARVRFLSIDQIRDRLNDRFRLLVGGGRALPRHRTLAAVLDWSYQNLEPRERQLLRQLSVFVGGWSVSGAAAVMPVPTDDLEALSLLERLVDKSLVIVEPNGNADPRYRMLETVRQYAEEQLVAAGERDAARSRHLKLYFEFVIDGPPIPTDDQYQSKEKQLDLELENIMAAHLWCDFADGGAETGLRLANAMRGYWFSRGAYEADNSHEQSPIAIGHRMTLDALARPRPANDTLHVGRAHINAGLMYMARGKREVAVEHLEKGLSIARSVGNVMFLVRALDATAEYHRLSRQYERSLQYLEEGAELLATQNRQESLAVRLQLQGSLHCLLGRFDVAEQLLQKGLEGALVAGDPWSIVFGHFQFAYLETRRQAGAEAAAHLLAGLANALNRKSRALLAYFLEVLVCLAVVQECPERAARFHGALVSHRERLRLDRDAPDETEIEPSLERAKSALGVEGFETSFAGGHRLSLEEAIAEARSWLLSIAPASAPL